MTQIKRHSNILIDHLTSFELRIPYQKDKISASSKMKVLAYDSTNVSLELKLIKYLVENILEKGEKSPLTTLSFPPPHALFFLT